MHTIPANFRSTVLLRTSPRLPEHLLLQLSNLKTDACIETLIGGEEHILRAGEASQTLPSSGQRRRTPPARLVGSAAEEGRPVDRGRAARGGNRDVWEETSSDVRLWAELVR